MLCCSTWNTLFCIHVPQCFFCFVLWRAFLALWFLSAEQNEQSIDVCR